MIKGSFSFDSIGVLKIESDDSELVSTYGSNFNEPCLPLLSVEVKVPQGMEFGKLTHSATKTLLFKNVSIAANPMVIPTDEQNVVSTQNVANYSLPSYPSKQVKFESNR